MHLTVERAVEDHGTVIILEGRDELDRLVTFAADRRPAGDIIDAMEAGIVPEVDVEGFAILHVGQPGASI